MRCFHRHSCSWSSSSSQVCPLSALTWKLADEHLCSFATPQEHGITRCRWTWSVARVYDSPCCQSWNYKIHQHTYLGYLPDDDIWYRLTQGLCPPECKVDVGHSLAAFEYLCIRFWPQMTPSTHSATANRYILSATGESLNSKHSASDSTQWRS